VEDTGQVGGDDVVPALQAQLPERAGVDDDAGVGDDHVEAAELGEAALDDGLDLGVVAHVGGHGDHAASGGLDLDAGLVQVLGGGHGDAGGGDVVADVEADDVGALFGQIDGDLAALPAAGAADEGDLVREAGGGDVRGHRGCPWSS
jgi:hypothetical protein